VTSLGVFTMRVPFFDHRTQGLCFCYLPNIELNKTKWDVLDNSNYDNFHGGGDFSHVYVIMHKYFDKKPEMQKIISFYIQVNMFS
jgi:hypothetical protein